jgi:hypothetical protein
VDTNREYFWLLSPRVGVEQFLGGYIWLVDGAYMVDALWMRTPKVEVA